MDKLRDVVERALKDSVLVVKVNGQFLKNPSMATIRKIFNQELSLKFRKIIGPDNKDVKYKYMQELHARGASVHVDMRWTLGDGKVSGVTIACPFGLPKVDEWRKEIDSVTEAVIEKKVSKKEDWADVKPRFKHKIRLELEKKVKQKFFVDAFLEKHRPDFYSWDRKHVFVPKAMQDTSWFEQPYTVIPPGFVGGSKYEWSVLAPFDSGEIEFGVIKEDYMELFVYSNEGFYTGKLSLVFLPREQVEASLPYTEDEAKLGKEIWVGFIFTTRSALPYMLSDRAVEEDYIPEKGVSSLPKAVRDKLPKDCQYWIDADRNKRDKAVEWANQNLKAYVRKNHNDIPKRSELWQL